ncbi:MAG: hypothetical protein ABIQ40_04310 [Bacteroidia bacterium]
MTYLFNEKLERYRRFVVGYHLPRLLISADRKAYLGNLKSQIIGFMLETEQDPYKQTIVTIVNEGYYLHTPLHKQFAAIQKQRVVFFEKQLNEIEKDIDTEIGDLAAEEGDKPILHFIIRNYTAEFCLQLIRELEKNPDQNPDEIKANVKVMIDYLLME